MAGGAAGMGQRMEEADAMAYIEMYIEINR